MPVYEWNSWQIEPRGWVDLGRLDWNDAITWDPSTSTTGSGGNYTYNWTTGTTSSNTLYTYYGDNDRGRLNNMGDRYRYTRWGTTREEMDALVTIEAAADQVAAQRRDRADARFQAQARADELLESMLSPEQVQAYQLRGEFEVIGSRGTLYRIKRGTSGNIEWIKPDGSVGGRICAHPDMSPSWLPTSDVMLAQMLALTTDEAAFVAVANVHAGERPPVRRYNPLRDPLMI